MDWLDYGGKHHESVFTRFYQGYILPNKFGIDKRKAHLSNLIFSGQINRKNAIEELRKPPYPIEQQRSDFTFIAKKLGFSMEEFAEVLTQQNRLHSEFGNDRMQRKFYFDLLKTIKPITSIIKNYR